VAFKLQHSMVAAMFVVGLATSTPVAADDLIEVGSSQRGLWTTTLTHFGVEKGIFKKNGLDVEINWFEGGSPLIQGLAAGSIDIAAPVGALAALTAWTQGAPIEIIGSDFRGGSDLFWFARSDSEIEEVDDLDGKVLGFSSPGTTTQLMLLGIVEGLGLNVELAPTGGPTASLTAVMSGQVDVGWSAPPIVHEQLESGQVRVIFDGNLAPGISEQTTRVHVANRDYIENNTEIVRRFMQSLAETIDWAYETDEALSMWAEMHGLSVDAAREYRDRHYPREAMKIDSVSGVDITVKQAVDTGRLESPLSDEEKVKLLSWVSKVN
jgi:NitT/TauT family transport system substrate-binding protein